MRGDDLRLVSDAKGRKPVALRLGLAAKSGRRQMNGQGSPLPADVAPIGMAVLSVLHSFRAGSSM